MTSQTMNLQGNTVKGKEMNILDYVILSESKREGGTGPRNHDRTNRVVV